MNEPPPPSHRPELDWLDSLQASGIRPGLGRVRAFLRHAGNPHRRYPALIVAGTNGKGSVSATLASILSVSGYKVGLYTSPHLVHLRERWMIDGAAVDESLLIEAIVELRGLADGVGFLPTYFEALTVIAFILFARTGRDVVVLEVGMGGRLDATNVVKPIASVITSISLDHTEFLGDTIEKIAREKAGVIHAGSVALTSNSDGEIVEVIRRKASSVGVSFHVVGDECTIDALTLSGRETRFNLTTPDASYAISSTLTGAHQTDNLTLAIRTAEEISKRFDRITRDSIEKGVEQTRWRGRFERFELGGREIFVDGAHNVAAAEAIVPSILQFVGRPRTLVFGIMGDKDVESVAKILFPHFDRLIFTIPYPARAASLERLCGIAHELARELASDAASAEKPEDAFRIALEGEPGSIVICGSLYLAGAAVEFLDECRNSASENSRVSMDARKAVPTA